MTPPPLVGTVLDGKFRIEKALASGASGDVYEAMHLGLGSRVAVKVLRPGAPETAHIRRKRFVREARVAARIQSDHVVRVFDIVAPERGPIYIVMELLNGETLADRIKRVGAMPPAEAVGYLIQATEPLAQMHDAGIVHRDVKPSNVFLARDAEGRERIKLLDFGVAAFQQPLGRGDSSITLTDAIVGTPRYMAPEQVRASKEVDARADVWALGVTLYELLVGSPPFNGQTVLAVLNQIEQQEPRPLAERQPSVSIELANIVHRCLAKDASRRPPDARALAEALAPFAGLAGSESLARPASDPLDLSLSDENVEVMSSRSRSLGSTLSRAKLGVKGKLAVAGAAIGIAALVLFARSLPSKRVSQADSPGPVAAPASPAPSPSPAPTPVRPSAATATSDTPSPTSFVTTTIAPVRDGATAHRAEPARPPTTPKRPAKLSSPRPASKAGRPPAEDDDRIE
jgi:eukaryotic-like serine/threonine-protein kinase